MAKPKPTVRKSTSSKGSVKKSHKPKDLASFQNNWSSTPVPEVTKRGMLPEGTYKATIEEALVDGDQVKFVYAINEPEEFARRKAFKTMNLGDEEGIGLSILKGDLAVLEVEIPDEITDLPETLASLEGVQVELFNRVKFNEKHGREFANIFLNGRSEVEGGQGTDGEDDAQDGAESEIVEGSTVEFKDGKKTVQGTVKAVDGDKATVDVEGEEWEVELAEMTLVEEETAAAPVKKSPAKKVAAPTADDGEDMIGKTVQFESDGEELSGEVTGIDAKGNYEVDVNGEVWAVDPAECSEVQAKKGPVKKAATPVKKRF